MRIGRFNIGRKAPPQITPEEEEDRARTLLTRRRFLFLGAAAAGAAVLPKLPLLEPSGYRTFLVGGDALIQLDPVQATLETYYNKRFLENLKSNIAYNVMFSMGTPPAASSRIRLFQPDGLLFNPPESLED